LDVSLLDADHRIDDQIDQEYHAKGRHAASIISAITSLEARSTTLRLAPVPSPTQEKHHDHRSECRPRCGHHRRVFRYRRGPRRALAAEGYRLALLARRVDRVQALARELGDGAIAIEADVTDRDSLVAAAERVERELGGADILVNNAGVMLLAPFTSEQQAEHRQMLEVNLLGAMTASVVFPDQLRDGGGDLVNISSVAGRTARAGNAVYAATKWAINGWSEGLRQELQPEVRVMVIEPGAVLPS
jgi:short chain dehydrogenase